MKGRIFTAISILSIFVMLAAPTLVSAQAYTVAFTTSITYQNIGSGPATVSIDFYPSGNGTPINISLPQLAQNAGTSLQVGSISQIGTGFKGSAVMSSDQPLAATMVQVPDSKNAYNVKNRPLSNAFNSGSSTVLIASALKNKFDTNSVISIQNVDSTADDLTVTFYDADHPGTTYVDTVTALPKNAAKYYDLGTLTQVTSGNLPSSLNASVTVVAKQTGTQTGGAVVATVMELGIAGRSADAFEGIPTGSNTIYMPSALCNYRSGSSTTNTSYAVQNTAASGNADVTVTYSNGKTDSFSVAAGTKHSFIACNAGNPDGFIGSAKITSTGASIIAVGKVYGGGASTAFIGASSGAAKLALPYVRWTTAHWTDGVRQRTFIAIQNIGSDPIPAGTVTITYLDKNGNPVGNVDTINTVIQPGGKVNSDPSKAGTAAAEFGAYSDNTYGGSAIVQSSNPSDQLVAIARVQSYVAATGEIVGEDYNGIPVTLP